MLVKSDRMPASKDADATMPQFTSPIKADVPIVAIAVCATVLIALIPAAFNHFFIVLTLFDEILAIP